MKYSDKILIAITVFLVGCGSHSEPENTLIDSPEEMQVQEATVEFGLPIDSFLVHRGEIARNQFLADLLLPHRITYPEIDKVVRNAKDVFDVRKINAGKQYTILCSPDTSQRACYFIYQPDAINYVVYELQDSMRVYRGQKPVELRERSFEGSIESSLYVTLSEGGVNPELALQLASLYAWTIDFYRIQKGDRVKVVFTERYVDGESAGLGSIVAANFEHAGKEFKAFRFTQDSVPDYFDEDGNSLRKAFLKMPLKYGRLTSGYTKRRFHPVQKRFKAHLGTDYAAPTGTPILAVGDGVVVESAFKQYNGNYVKIRHNSTYTTQYLHMSKRMVKTGEYVRQGQTIGLVGSTGLATGPHVCFRFWKNGEQVDHRREEFPPSEPITPANKDRFEQMLREKDSLISFSREENQLASQH